MSIETKRNPAFDRIITRNTEMLSIFQYIESIVKSREPILITGEVGAGKSLMAECIHAACELPGTLVRVDAVGLDDQQFSDLVFGHIKDVYPGADEDQAGLVESATDGTIFFNEIGVLSLASQIKLLRLLQYGEYLPLGESTPRKSNALVLTATSADLWSLQRAGKFRKDLNLKIRTHHVHLPALRERIDDLLPLVEHFLETASRDMEKKQPTPPRELVTLLKTHTFPGNVRELRNMVYDAVRNHKAKVLSLDVFKDYMDRGHGVGLPGGDMDLDEMFPFRAFRELPTIKKATMMLIEEAMRRAGGNQSIAARMLGISQPAMSKRLKDGYQS